MTSALRIPCRTGAEQVSHSIRYNQSRPLKRSPDRSGSYERAGLVRQGSSLH